MTGYYVTDPADPHAPVLLEEYNGIKPGDLVVYENPEAPWLPPLHSLTVDAIYQFTDNGYGGWVSAILNDGEYEVNADHLRLTRACPGVCKCGACHHQCDRARGPGGHL